MKTRDIIEGLAILEKYRESPDGCNCGAEHDVLYAYATDRPVLQPDLDRLVEMGWFQGDADYGDDEETGGDFAAKHYLPDEGWECFT
jgi:hypothetical protein